MKMNQKGFSAVEILIVIVIIALVGFVGWRVYDSSQNTSTPNETSQQLDDSSSAEAEEVTDSPTEETNEPENVARVEQELSDDEKENCTAAYPEAVDSPFEEDGFSILPASISTALLSCHTDDEKRFTLIDDSLRINVLFTENDFLRNYSGAPGDETWTATLSQEGSAYPISIVDKNKDNLIACETLDKQNCGGGYGINVSVEHPRFNAVIISLYDEGMHDTPSSDLYDTVLSSITLPE